MLHLALKIVYTRYLFSLDAESVAAAMERVMSCPDIKHHVDKMAAILRTRKESPAKVRWRQNG
jgi:hypothetical protein